MTVATRKFHGANSRLRAFHRPRRYPHNERYICPIRRSAKDEPAVTPLVIVSLSNDDNKKSGAKGRRFFGCNEEDYISPDPAFFEG
jgi:hypothetical protein